jgi:hypothetical protein
MPVEVQHGQPSSNFTTRSTDTPGFNAGGMIKGSDGSGCTSGFAIRINGVSHTTTARHCSATPFHAWGLPSSNYGTTTMTSGIGGLGGSVTTIRVHQMTSGQIAGAHGDSGGPIVIPNSDGTHVWAVGMLEGSNEAQTSSCGSMRVATQCSAYIEFTSMRTIINSIAGASLQTT